MPPTWKHNVEDVIAERQSFRLSLEQLGTSFPLDKALPASLKHAPRDVETENLGVGREVRFAPVPTETSNIRAPAPTSNSLRYSMQRSCLRNSQRYSVSAGSYNRAIRSFSS
jgi:hypothetical protein